MYNPAFKTSTHNLIKKTASALLLLIVLGIAFWVRSFTFWLPHWTGDQSQYIALAMKMNHTPGLSAYNLREVNVRAVQMSAFKDFNFVIPTYAAGEEGSLMKSYYGFGLSYYDMPLWYKAPLLPYALKWSHNLFLGTEKPFVVPQTNIGTAVFKIKPKAILDSQFWLVIVPLASSLGTLLIIYFFARRFLGISGSLMAVWIMAFNPVSILCSNRIWTEDLQTFFLWLGLLLYWKGLRKSKSALSLIAGLSIGCSALTNQKSILFLPGLWLYSTLSDSRFNCVRPLQCIRAFFNRSFVWLFAGFGLISCWWFLIVFRQYNNFFWQPDFSAVTSDAGASWIKLLNSRPHSFIVYVVGGFYLCPPLALGYVTIYRIFFDIIKMIKHQTAQSIYVFLWLACLPLLYIFIIKAHNSAEHRYLLTVLPALSILSAITLTRFYERVSVYFLSKKILAAFIWIGLILSSIWSVRIAWQVIMSGKVLIDIPF